MIKPNKDVMILCAGILAGIVFTAAGVSNGLRLLSPYATKEVEAAALLANSQELQVADLEAQKEKLEAELSEKEAKAVSIQKELKDKTALYEDLSAELVDLEEYQNALLNMEDYFRPLKLVADMTIYWGYDFERAGSLSGDTNVMNSLNGMFGNIVTDLLVKGVNDKKNDLVDVVVQFNREVEPYVNSNMKLVEDAKNIIHEIEFCSQLLNAPEDQDDLLMNLRIVKKRYGGIPTPEFYEERMKQLLPGLYQGRDQFQFIAGTYQLAFQNEDDDGVRSMEHAYGYFDQAVDAYRGDYGQEWYEHCEKVGLENYYPIVKAHKALIASCMDYKAEMKELLSKVYHMESDTYGECDLTVYYKKIDGESKILCIEDEALTGEKLGKFYYDFDGWPVYHYSYLDQAEVTFVPLTWEMYLGETLIKEEGPQMDTMVSYYRIAQNIRWPLLSDIKKLKSWYKENRFLIE